MADYIDVNGVRTWYDERGAGETLVLLHGGLTDSRDFTGNLDALAARFRLLLPERRGHGRTPDVPGPLSMDALAADTVAFIEKSAGGPVRLVGYSAGALVALWVAVRRPELVERLVLVSGAFDPDGMILRPSAAAQPAPPLVAAYAEVSPDGAEHFPVVMAKVARSVTEDVPLAAVELAAVTCPALVMAADDDIVTLEHTLTMYRGLPDAQLAVVPGTSHLLLHEKPELCTQLITDFLTGAPTATWMPIRRATPHEAVDASPTSRPRQEQSMVTHDAAEPTEFPTRLGRTARRELALHGYTRYDQLTTVTGAELVKIHGVGPKAIRILEEELEARNLSFAGP